MTQTISQQRSTHDRRSGHDRRNLSLAEAECLRCCRLAGAMFIGIQHGFAHVPDQCLFQAGPKCTTLAVPVAQLTPLAITVRLHESKRQYRAAFEMWFPQPSTTREQQARA
jgi:hypothetical protein